MALDNLEVDRENIPPHSQVNAVQSNTQILAIIENLQKKVEALTTQIQNKNSSTNLDINSKTRKPYKHYYWMCVCYSHWGRNYPGVKAAGHKDEATFINRMGG